MKPKAAKHQPDLERLEYLKALEYLDAGEAAELIRTHRDEIYKLAGSGRLRCTRFGKKLVFSRAELDRFMSGHDHHAPEPMTPAVRRELAARAN